MSTKQDQVSEIGKSLSSMRSHIAGVRKLAREKANEEVLESLTNVGVCVESLESARLTAAPVLVLSELATAAEGVATAIANTASNFDAQHGNFTNQVNNLHRKLWADGLIDPEAEVEAYQGAAAELEQAMKSVRASMATLKEALVLKEDAEKAASAAVDLQQRADEAAKSAEAKKTETEQLLAQATQVHNSFNGQAKEIGRLLDDSESKNTTLRALEADLKKWHAEIKTTREGLDKLDDTTASSLQKYDDDISERRKTLDDFQERIEEQFRLASSGALAKAFGARQGTLLFSTFGWGALALCAYIGFPVAMYWQGSALIDEINRAQADGGVFHWEALVLRLAVALPFLLLVWFVTAQYGRARRLRESYAFKETVASSFDAYRDLVETITKDEALKSNPKYADFIRQTIEGLYREPPISKEEDDRPPHLRLPKGSTELVEALTKLVAEIKGR